MVKTASIKRNYIYNLTYQIFAILIPLVTSPYLARILQPDGIGAYSYANSIATYFCLLAVLGTSTYASRELARIRDDESKVDQLYWEIVLFRIVTTFISVLLYFLVIYFSGYDFYLYFACAFSIFSVAVDSGWYFEANEKFKVLVAKDFIVKIVSLVLIFTLVKQKDDLLIYVLIQTVGIFLPNLILTLYLLKKHNNVSFANLHFKKHLKETLIYFIPSIASSIYTVLDKTMIGLIVNNNSENGYYDLAYKIYMIILTMITSLTTVISARSSFLFGKGKIEEVKGIIYKSLDFLGMIVIPAIIGIFICTDNFVLWYYGETYFKVASLIKCLSPLLLIIGISNILWGGYLTPVGKKEISAKAIVIGSMVNLCCNLLLIPRYGSYGATVGSIIAESVITMIYIYFTYKFISYKKAFSKYYTYLFAALGMGLCTYLIGNLGINRILITILQLLFGCIIYFGILLLWKNEDVIMILRNIIYFMKRKLNI